MKKLLWPYEGKSTFQTIMIELYILRKTKTEHLRLVMSCIRAEVECNFQNSWWYLFLKHYKNI